MQWRLTSHQTGIFATLSPQSSTESADKMMGVSWLLVILSVGLARGQSNGDVRINSNGHTTTNEGVIEMYLNGKWNLVCNDDRAFNFDAAKVVCRQTGFASVYQVIEPHKYYDPRVDQGKTLLAELSCTGAESSLAECDGYGPSAPASTCPGSRSTIAAVMCADARLVETTDDGYSGRVEVYNRLDGQWYGVCGDRWDRYNGNIACNQIFPGTNPYNVQTYLVESTADMGDNVFSAILCNGFENTLNECSLVEKVSACVTQGAVNCVTEDALKFRAAQLLLQLLKDKK